WTDRSWRGGPLHGSVLYEMHVGTFTADGTLDAAIGRLGHLRDLGVHTVELMPVAAFPGRHGWGYDGINLWAVHEPYGGPDGLKRFVDAWHALEDHRALHFLEELATEVHALAARLNRELILIAESDTNDPRLVTSREAGGYGLAAQWSDDFHHAVHAAITGERQGYYCDFGS